MTITALACPEPDRDPPMSVAAWIRAETGHQHAAWCTTVVCGGDCSTSDQYGDVRFGAYLPRDRNQPKITIGDPVTGTTVELDGPTAAQLAHRILSVTNSAGIPARWLRRPLS